MIQVLIAEDEIPLLRGIKIMIEKLNPEFTVVKCAHNGKEAIEYLEDHPVDVIFTDINMPLADGIDVMEFAMGKYPQAVKVVISGYSDFTYAQQAIRCEVKDYLLKPIVKEELEQILHNILELYTGKLQKQQKARLTNAVYSGKYIQQKEERHLEKVQMVYVCAGPFVKEGLEESVVECDFWKGMEVEEAAASLLPEDAYVYSFEKNQANERIVLIVPKEEIDLKAFSTELAETMKKEGVQVTAAYHQEAIEIQHIPSVSHQLRKEIQKNILLGRESVFADGQERGREGTKEDIPYFAGRKIPAEKERIVLKEFETFFKDRELYQEDGMALLTNLIGGILENAGIQDEKKEETEETVLNLILYSSDTEQLFTNLRQMLEEKNLYRKPETTQDLMKKVESYVKEHMAEPITAAVLAAEFGLVAPYLSRLFKEYSGYTLSQYIQKIRLERAKYLLDMDEGILAKDVAEMVGYPNPLYFSKLFKKKVGVYPSEYRKDRQGRGAEMEVQIEI